MPRAGWEDRLANWPEALKLADADTRKPAEEVYRNIQSLKGSGAGGLAMTMSVFSAALGVSCDYCHIEGQWDSDARPAKKTARRMLGLFAEFPHYFESSRQPSMQCYTCHQGSPKPQRRPVG
jgi:Photosynthetic reaction centre cytochrome C subunit